MNARGGVVGALSAGLLRWEPDTGAADPIALGQGTVSEARVHPDGSLWYVFESSSQPSMVRSRTRSGDTPAMMPLGDVAPTGRPYESLCYPNGEGDQVHAFLARPDGDGPHPLLVYAHGGPFCHARDDFDPHVQAWVDHGFAVLMPNYRGSSGYGRRWQERLVGDPGRPELVDLEAGRDHLVQRGIADPGRVVLCGFSYGASTASAHPSRTSNRLHRRARLCWCSVVLTTHAAPIDNYVVKLREHGVPHRYVEIPTVGHLAMDPVRSAEQVALSLDFVAEHLGTAPAQRARTLVSPGRG